MLKFREASKEDSKLFFDWVNDSEVRRNSFISEKILFENHQKWFDDKINDPNCLILVFENKNENIIGQVRIEKNNLFDSVIGISIDNNYRGKGHSFEMLTISSNFFLEKNKKCVINAYIKTKNKKSMKAFEKAGFKLIGKCLYKENECFHFIKRNTND